MSSELAIDEKQLNAEKKQVEKAGAFATSLEIKTEEDYTAALEEGKAIKDLGKTITARKEEITKPINASLKSIRALFAPMEDTVEGALALIKSKMLKYSSDKKTKEDAEKAKLDARVEKGTMKEETAERKKNEIDQAKMPNAVVASSGAAAVTTKRKAYRVIDKAKIPLQFMEPDMVKIKASFRAGTPVEGVEEYLEEGVSLY